MPAVPSTREDVMEDFDRQIDEACPPSNFLEMDWATSAYFHRAPLGGVAKRRPQTLSARRVDFEVILSDGSPDYQQNHFELILRNFPCDDFLAKNAIE